MTDHPRESLLARLRTLGGLGNGWAIAREAADRIEGLEIALAHANRPVSLGQAIAEWDQEPPTTSVPETVEPNHEFTVTGKTTLPGCE